MRNESVVTKHFCYLLSYGLEVVEFHLHIIYLKFNFCVLFKILLHIDIRKQDFAFYLDYLISPGF